MNGSTGFFAVSAGDELAIPAPRSRMATSPRCRRAGPAARGSCARGRPPALDTASSANRTQAARAHDVQHAITVANVERPRGAAARVAARDVRGERDRPDADRVAVLEPVVDARGPGTRRSRSRRGPSAAGRRRGRRRRRRGARHSLRSPTVRRQTPAGAPPARPRGRGCGSEFRSTLTSLMSKPSFAMLAMIIGAVPG